MDARGEEAAVSLGQVRLVLPEVGIPTLVQWGAILQPGHVRWRPPLSLTVQPQLLAP